MLRYRPALLGLLIVSLAGLPDASLPGAEPGKILSHPPLRIAPPPIQRTKAQRASYFVDARQGEDQNPGSEEKPWKTVRQGLLQLVAGDTLYLRAGVYYEQLQVRLAGRQDAPITIASYPGEQAIVDGGLREFFEEPATAWQPFPTEVVGELRSARRYPNLRNVVGAFGDSMIGLQTYYHPEDLRASGELVEQNADNTDINPHYCGPGLWYNPATGYIHARIQHTQLTGCDNYRGETDPRKLPLVIAPFRSIPLHVDGARHVRFQDLIIRGGGYETVVLEQASDIEFDNVTVWCGTYGLRAMGAQRLKFFRSALYGSIAPWTTRYESGLNTYPGRTQRDITRLNTHALLVTDSTPEFSVYHSPFNDDWEISYSEFTEGSDGLYLGGVGMRFHHNVVDNMQDDGIYLSPMYERAQVFGGGAKLYLYQNYFGRALTMLAYGGTEKNRDTVFFYRNLVDMRGAVQTGRPTTKSPTVTISHGKVTGDHGSPPWSAMNTYHNTFINRSPVGSAEMWMAHGVTEAAPHKVFNNVFLHLNRFPDLALPNSPDLQVDGNLYWQPGVDPQRGDSFFKTYRNSPAFEQSKKAYPPGFDANSLFVDPLFVKLETLADAANDYRLRPASPAIDAGVELPEGWPDPLRSQDRGKPDIGALPLEADWNVGRAAAP